MAWANPVSGEKEKGSKFNAHVESMLKVYLAASANPLEAIKGYVESNVSEIKFKIPQN